MQVCHREIVPLQDKIHSIVGSDSAQCCSDGGSLLCSPPPGKLLIDSRRGLTPAPGRSCGYGSPQSKIITLRNWRWSGKMLLELNKVFVHRFSALDELI